MDTSKIGHVAAGAMEYLENEYGDRGAAYLADAVLVIAIRDPDEEETICHVESGKNGPPWYVIAGLLQGGLTALGTYERHDD